MVMLKHTLVLRHYVKHCRLTDEASIQVTGAAGELAGVAASRCAFPGVAAPYRRATLAAASQGRGRQKTLFVENTPLWVEVVLFPR